MVHRAELRSGDSASFHVLQKSTRAVSRVEVVRAVVRTNRTAVRGSWIGAGPAVIPGLQLGGRQCGKREPHSTGAAGGRGRGASHRARVSKGTGTTKPGGRTGA